MAGSCEHGNKLRGSMWAIAGIAEEMLAAEEGLCPMQVFCYLVRFVSRSKPLNLRMLKIQFVHYSLCSRVLIPKIFR